MDSPGNPAEIDTPGEETAPGSRQLHSFGFKITVDLRKLITDTARETLTTLDLSEPTAGSWSLTDGRVEREFDVTALSVFSGKPTVVIRKLGVRDFRDALSRIGQFFPVDDLTPIEDAEPTLTVELRAPAKEAGVTYERLELTEPSAGAWGKWSGMSGTAADIRAVATVANIPEDAVRQMLVGDVKLAAVWISRFFVDAPATGAQS